MFRVHVTKNGVSPIIEEGHYKQGDIICGFHVFKTFEEAKSFLLMKQTERIEAIKEELEEAIMIRQLIEDEEY